MSLPIKKIYIDSKHKVSGSNSDFRCQLKDSYLMPENAVFKNLRWLYSAFMDDHNDWY